jgi:hypothetical protein
MAFATYEHCRRYIEQHWLTLRTLEQIASECHVNNAYPFGIGTRPRWTIGGD